MEYQELVTVLADKSNYTRREVRNILRLLVDVIRDAIENGRDVRIRALGRFANVETGPKVGRHPGTLEVMHIPATRKVKFDPTKEFKRKVKESVHLFRKESLETKYGLPRKEKPHGEVCSGNRPQQGAERKEGRGRR